MRVSRDIFAVARDPDVDVLVELIGGSDTALELALEGIRCGKHLVTANKALLATHGARILAAARMRGLGVAFEAAVAGGIPIIKGVREGLAANRIFAIAGIFNGTTNYILSSMEGSGRDFAAVLAEAQEQGYAEADPTLDINGVDAACKLIILAALAFDVPLAEGIHTEGIGSISRQDMHYARELGFVIKHLGLARQRDGGCELRVHPVLLPRDSLLAGVGGVLNAIKMQAEPVGEMFYQGAGAGAGPTASAVVADLLDIARGMEMNARSWPLATAFSATPGEGHLLLPVAALETRSYLRLILQEGPSALQSAVTILHREGIGIETLVQKATAADAGGRLVPTVLLTRKAPEEAMHRATRVIGALPGMGAAPVRIRVEEDSPG